MAYTKNVIYLEDGEIADITPDRITVYDSIGKNLEKSITRIAWDIAAAEKGGYDHFMLKEIMEQPNAIKSTIEPRIQNGEVVLDDFSLTDEDLEADQQDYDYRLWFGLLCRQRGQVCDGGALPDSRGGGLGLRASLPQSPGG